VPPSQTCARCLAEAEGYTVVIEEGQPPGDLTKLKRPRDPIELDKLIGNILTGQWRISG